MDPAGKINAAAMDKLIKALEASAQREARREALQPYPWTMAALRMHFPRCFFRNRFIL